MEQYMAFIWFGIAVVTAIIEAAGPALVSIWFTGGAVTALVLALFGAPIWLQLAVFVVVTAVLLAATRPIARKYVNARLQPTNADRIIGSICQVTEQIDNRVGRGEVYVDGKRWSARSDSDEPIAEGAEVEILRIEGVKVIVREHSAAAVPQR